MLAATTVLAAAFAGAVCTTIPHNATNVIFIGNPGKGKSTLLNIHAGKALFQSGVSIGAGLTRKLCKEVVGDRNFIDLPGLADVDDREGAAAALTQALMQPGPTKLFLVTTLEGGRVNEDDVVTLRLALESAPDVHSYGVIVNKVSGHIKKELERNQSLNATFRKQLMAIIPFDMRTSHFLILSEEPQLKDKGSKDVDFRELHKRYSHLHSFIDAVWPAIIDPRNVTPVNHRSFSQMKADYDKEKAKVAREVQMREEAERKAELERRQREQAEKKAAEERRRRAEADRRAAESKRRAEQEQSQREQAEKQAEEDRRHRAEANRRAEEAKRRAEQEQVQREQAQKQAEEDRRLREEAHRKAEEARWRAELDRLQREQAQKQAEEDRRRREEAERRAEEDRRRREEADRRAEEAAQERRRRENANDVAAAAVDIALTALGGLLGGPAGAAGGAVAGRMLGRAARR